MKNLKYILLLSYICLFTSNIGASLLLTPEQEQMLEAIPADQRDTTRLKMLETNKLTDEIQEVYEEESNLVKRPELKDQDSEKIQCPECIYGYEIFKYAPSTFSPSNNIPLPSSYILGPGDKIKLNYFGSTSSKLRNIFQGMVT